MRMSGNTILITGGTSGIGLGLALRFYAEGNTVIVAGRRAQLLASVVAEHPGMDSVVLDVADAEAIRRGVADVVERHPDLDMVINNAGIMLPEDLTDAGHQAVAEQTVVTNLLGPIRLLTEVVPFLAAKPAAVVMNVSPRACGCSWPARGSRCSSWCRPACRPT
jgi:uncharacterized oxidoreductase